MTAAKPLVLITGAGGNIGSALANALRRHYQIVGLDRDGGETPGGVPIIAVDITSDQGVERAFGELRRRHGGSIASVIHLAAYFDVTGEDNELYRTVNVEGTRRLLHALQEFDVGQFVYSDTMLVHRPGRPGERIDESQPIEPKWAYPRSKAEAEEVIRRERGRIPAVLLHLAGLYDRHTAVPTLAQQIARIYERDVQSMLYSGDVAAGQSMLHRDDMIDAFRRVVDRRAELPPEITILIGEPDKPLPALAKEMVAGGVSLPWNLALCAAIGVWLMFTRLTLEAQGAVANLDHAIGALVLTTTAIACAEIARPARLLNGLWAIALAAATFFLEVTALQDVVSIAVAMGLLLLSIPKGRIRSRYGDWDRRIV